MTLSKESIARQNASLVRMAEESVVQRSNLLERTLFSAERERDNQYGKISGSAERLLKVYGREPYKSKTELYEVSGLGTKGSKARKELAIAGFIQEKDLSVKTRKGAGKQLLNITEKGKSWLRDCGIKPLITGKGGPKELYYSVEIQCWALGKNFAVYREWKGVDLVLVNEMERVAVEIACRRDHQVTNIKKDLDTRLFQKIVVACETEKIKKDVETEYMSSGIDPGTCQVTFLDVKELMP